MFAYFCILTREDEEILHKAYWKEMVTFFGIQSVFYLHQEEEICPQSRAHLEGSHDDYIFSNLEDLVGNYVGVVKSFCVYLETTYGAVAVSSYHMQVYC